jgi:4-amino-4-deoxy-L-arabinose transferase-like glycosyltransferase
MRPTPSARAGRATLIVLLLAFWLISLRHLTVVPPVYEDEPWQASSGWKLATAGVFGSDLFAGLYDMDQRYYGYLPLHPLLLAAVYRAAGIGLLQTRLEPVALGLLTMALAATMAQALWRDRRVGLLALLLLLLLRLNSAGPFRLTGIPLLDTSRIARYDMTVPVFGLAAWYIFWRTTPGRFVVPKRRAVFGYLLAGLLAALASLGHLYGAFWLPVLLLLACWTPTPGRVRRSIGLLIGFLIPWLLYLPYVLTDLPAWRGQTSFYGERFQLFDLPWYLTNLRQEPLRYALWLPNDLLPRLARVGAWVHLLGLPAVILVLTRRAWHDAAARALLLPAVLLPALMALLIFLKLPNYLVLFTPVWCLALAWGGVTLWNWLVARRARVRVARWLLAVLLMAVVLEGATRLAALETAAAQTTPYPAFIQQVRGWLPPGSRVLGLHNYWLGLEDHDYRSFAVPILWTDPAYTSPLLTFDAALSRVAPDVILLDAHLRDYFTHHRDQEAALNAWLVRHNGRRVASIVDATYGALDIYWVQR